MKTMLTRTGGAAAAVAIGASLVLIAAPAQAATPEQTSTATWLAAQVDDDSHVFSGYYADFQTGEPVEFTDLGLNLDLQFALRGLGDTATADEVYDAVVARADEYTDSFGTRYAGAVGKLASYVQQNGDDPSDLDGRDLIADLEALVVTSGEDAGRALDSPDGQFQSANNIGQSWDVRALVAANSDLADEATAYLLKQQCDDGSFRQGQSGACTGAVDATAFAITALQDASDSIAGLDDDIAEAVTWLEGKQAADGSFSDAGNANANSTGLAAVALRELSDKSPAPDLAASAWLDGVQVKSGDEAGAIALTTASYSNATSNGISQLKRDEFVRATAQAALGLSVLPASSLVVAGPTATVSKGRPVVASATGLEFGEQATFSLSGGNTVKVKADDQGKATATVIPAGIGTRTLTVTGANGARKGSTKLSILGPKTFPTTLKYSTVKAGKTQTVKVTGLVANEPVRVYYAGQKLKTAAATASGTYTLTFNARTAKGTKTVTVLGLFGDRKGTKSFKVN